MLLKSYYLKVFSIFVFLFPVFVEGYSGERKHRQFNIGAGWAHMGLRDRGISPLYYSGNHLFLAAGFNHRTEKISNQLEVNFLYGNLSPAIYPGLNLSQMQSFKAGISFSHMRLAGNLIGNKGFFFLGGIIGSQFAYYEHNQFANSAKKNFSFSTINISSSLSYPFSLNERECNLSLQIYMPVIAFIIRPNHSYIRPEGFLDHNAGNLQSLFNSVEIASLNKFFGLGSELSFRYKLRSNNTLRIGYRWEYTGHNNINKLKTATHGIILQTFF
jgi:hypothetical protein